MYSRIGAAAFKENLTNTITLCRYLDDPQTKFKTIHVAGTNGKGSVSHMLAAILQTAGYKTGLYTSPHLKDFRERIKINGEMISREFVIEFTEKIKPVIEEIEPSFFEITVAMAFDYFYKEKVNIAIIEVGLGGRLDSTNIITPELSVITNIGFDHMNMLGDSLEQIAFEKAGIIKPGIPAVIGEILPETKKVFDQTAEKNNTKYSVASHVRQVTDWNWKAHELITEVAQQNKTDHSVYHLDLQGIYQTKNLLTVLEACTQLKHMGWRINENEIHDALKQVKKITGLHGRWEIIHHSPMVILDVAHNVDGIQQLVQQLEIMEPRQLHIIIGLVKDKEAKKILAMLPKEADYYFTKAQVPRAMHENELDEIGKNTGLHGETFSDVNTALQFALQKAGKEDLILVCGSVFLVGEVEGII